MMRVFSLLLPLLLLAGCAGIPGTGKGKDVVGYDRQVNVIDTQYLHQMDRTMVGDPELIAYVQGIRGKLEAAHGEPCDCVVLVDSFSGYEAYSISTKTVVVSAGVVAQAGSEDELAAIIAHELGHAYSWDAVKGMVQDASVFAVSAAGWIAGAGGYSVMLEDYIKDVSRGLIYKRWNIKQETDADLFAVDLLVKAGYSVRGLKMAIRKLAQYGSHAVPPSSAEAVCAAGGQQFDDKRLKACSKVWTGANDSVYQERDSRLKAVLVASGSLTKDERRRALGKAPPRFASVDYLFGMNQLVATSAATLRRGLARVERTPMPFSLEGNVSVTNRLAMAHFLLGNKEKSDAYLVRSFLSPNRTVWTFTQYYRYLSSSQDPDLILETINQSRREVGPNQALLPIEAYLAKRYKLPGILLETTGRCWLSLVGDVKTLNLCSEFEKRADAGGRAPW
ncbi:M48 family metalloprotease [Castellaniella sp.]|uniref:M48 family metalloprotease n=1 Tax=Castellaniella sp. TaxID=1955812 RepID=UPI003C73C4E3